MEQNIEKQNTKTPQHICRAVLYQPYKNTQGTGCASYCAR